uniref:m7GpppN-mRNA hydrolase NUDT17 n=1 Tax=Sphenodon punctatus TaxID=8508 RepID=A0A8D0GA71_SPHPU
MEGIKRALVHLSKENSVLLKAHAWRFVSPDPPQSVTGHFSASHEDTVLVSCGLDQNRFLISDKEFAGSNRVILKRPSFCPIKNLEERQAASLPAKIQGRGVDVGVAVLLQSASRKVLLTRRAKNLRIFPHTWVPPGTLVTWTFSGPQLLEAGLRELQEETGLVLQDGGFSWRMLGLWESVYPPLLSRGLPRRHHIVVYLLVLSDETHQALELRKHCLSNLRCFPNRVMEVQGGSPQPSDLPTVTLLNTAPAEGEDVERVSTGTKFALRLWLDTRPVSTSPC